MWEDKSNVSGGKWVLELSKSEDLDIASLWKNTLAYCISERAKDMLICGCVFSPRRFADRIAIWTGVKDHRVKQVGEMWREWGPIPENLAISFKAHETAIRGIREPGSDLFKI